MKMVAQFYTCSMVNNTTITLALYLKKDLKFACGSVHWKVAACELL